MTTKKQQVADFFKSNMDWTRFARLTQALGNQANNAQLRFLKATLFEQSIETYSNGKIKYVGEEGCDHIIDEPNLYARIEMKYTEGALYTASKKTLRESTGGIKLMNSMGTNTHKVLPSTYADFLLFVGNQGAMLFDRATVAAHITAGGDGITANIPTKQGIILATPTEMNAGDQPEVDFIGPFDAFNKSYISNIK
jgi:hypothetical protein